jgi:hypothetical protein
LMKPMTFFATLFSYRVPAAALSRPPRFTRP